MSRLRVRAPAPRSNRAQGEGSAFTPVRVQPPVASERGEIPAQTAHEEATRPSLFEFTKVPVYPGAPPPHRGLRPLAFPTLRPSENRTGLPETLKAGLENLSGQDLSQVRVRYGSAEPERLSARAFTRGQEIHVAPGEESVLPHEAWHVVQQMQGRVRPTLRRDGVGINDDRALEREADEMGARAEAGAESPSRASTFSAPPGTAYSNVHQLAKRTLEGYFKELIENSEDDPDWDPDWTEALEQAAKGKGVLDESHKQQYEDSDQASHIRAWLKTQSTLSSKPPIYKKALQAVNWYEGIESSPSGSKGLASLAVEKESVEGRPDFPQSTKETVTILQGQHRRHILPWHAISYFMGRAWKKRKTDLMKAIDENHQNESIKGPLKEGLKIIKEDNWDNLGQSDRLRVALFVMNGNIRNLWAGRGNENSSLNTAQVNITKALEDAHNTSDLKKLAKKWKNIDAKIVYRTATRLAAQTLEKAIEETNNNVDETKKRVRDWVISNLRLDVLAPTKKQTKKNLEQYQGLKAAIKEVMDVVDREKTIDEADLDLVVKELMTY